MAPTYIIDPPRPHGAKQALIMQAFMHPGIEEIYVANGTKWGKTISASSGIINAFVSKQRATFRWVAPIFEQSRLGYDYCRRILPPPPHVTHNNSGLKITLPSSDSMIQFYHAQNPVSLEGAAISGYVFDEAAKMKEEAYSSAKTTVTVTRGTMLFISTPLGKNWFYRKCMEAKDEMLRARHEKRPPRQLFITAPTADNPFVPRESIESARRSLPGRLFRQYYEAVFEDQGSVFTDYKQCLTTAELELWGDEQQWFTETAKQSRVVIGVDWAKTVDYCCFIAVDLATRHVVGVSRFHKQPYTEAIRRLVLFTRKFGSCDAVYHDKTGVGMAIDDQLAYTGLNYRGVTFTNALKAEMVAKLMTAFEQRSILIPAWPTLLGELEAFEVQVSDIGTLRYAAAGSGHDDTVCALLLAHTALNEYADSQNQLSFLEDLMPPGLSQLEVYYRGLADDDG